MKSIGKASITRLMQYNKARDYLNKLTASVLQDSANTYEKYSDEIEELLSDFVSGKVEVDTVQKYLEALAESIKERFDAHHELIHRIIDHLNDKTQIVELIDKEVFSDGEEGI